MPIPTAEGVRVFSWHPPHLASPAEWGGIKNFVRGENVEKLLRAMQKPHLKRYLKFIKYLQKGGFSVCGNNVDTNIMFAIRHSDQNYCKMLAGSLKTS